ncbi:mitochondrial uncoupling protein 4-like isoform X2 [Diorhabda carinulata]|uniref:mitochondrial uncoupling protein 4-like isoform X2 n=1 Tax=Diorhabda carinulata TaxID=1163345 RepID=UPI0025A0B4D0|nr:mitochondrial uncoupling protein 4-like isoform X2 [Diorhabda carinulata]
MHHLIFLQKIYVYITSAMMPKKDVMWMHYDLVKTRLQIQGETASKVGTGPKKGMIGTTASIVKEDGIFGLWRGVSAIFARHLIYSGLRIAVYRQMKDVFIKQYPEQKIFPVWQGAICGITAGMVGQFFASPADLIKVQLQMEGKRRMLGLPARVHGFRDAFYKIYEPGGIRGLWKGWVPSVQRAALVTFGDMTTYDISKRFIQRHSQLEDRWLLHSLSSMIAGFAGAVLSTPADVIKSRVMNQPTDKQGKGLLYKGSIDCFQKAVKEEGFLALYKGFIPTWIRLGPWALVFWVSYEQIRSLIGGELF